MKLYVVSTRSVGSFRAMSGRPDDIRVRDPLGWSFSDPGRPNCQRNNLRAVRRLRYQANPRTFVMAEIDGVPEYRFRRKGPTTRGDPQRLAGAMGVRFYFSPYIAVDSGVRYRSDYDGIADANIHASMNILIR